LTRKHDSFEQYRPYLMGLAYRLLGSRADAEDAVQDTWLRWQNSVRPKNDRAWLTRVCTNTCIDALRRLKRERARYEGPWLPDPVSREGEQFHDADTDGDLNGIISHLSRDVELWSDGGGKALAARNVIAGASAVAAFLTGVFRKTASNSRWETGAVNGKPAALLYDANHILVTLLTITTDARGQVDRLLVHRNPDKLSRATEKTIIC